MLRDHAECVGEGGTKRVRAAGRGEVGFISEIQGCEKQLGRTDVAERLLGAKVTYDEMGKVCRAEVGRQN